jgi:hypothetical protein
MTKQLIVLAFAAAFGIAHAADVKPTAVTGAPAAAAATVKAEAANPEMKIAEAKPAIAAPTAPEVKKEAAPAVEKVSKTEKKVSKKAEPMAAPDAAKVETAKLVEPAKK